MAPGPWKREQLASGSRAVWRITDARGARVVGIWDVGERAAAIARLIALAPELLELARRWASECAACHGTGRTIVATDHIAECCESGDCEKYPVMQKCEDCADIRAVIDRAEGLVS